MKLSVSQNRSGQYGGKKILILPGHELRPLCHLARSQLLHYLHYSGSYSFSLLFHFTSAQGYNGNGWMSHSPVVTTSKIIYSPNEIDTLTL
jgi:hypothetical protein